MHQPITVYSRKQKYITVCWHHCRAHTLYVLCACAMPIFVCFFLEHDGAMFWGKRARSPIISNALTPTENYNSMYAMCNVQFDFMQHADLTSLYYSDKSQ